MASYAVRIDFNRGVIPGLIPHGLLELGESFLNLQ